jgi:RNA polymerase sigma factor (sigma-70 family)
MSTESQVPLGTYLRRLACEGEAANDAELLGRFVGLRDEAAFTAIVRRHGPMVFGVCRRVLHHTQDAEDAFQATFLVLARKARAVGDRAALANWLYGVAYRTALKARATTARRLAKEKQMPLRARPTGADDCSDLEVLLDQELHKLADKYRLPVVLCDLEGLSRKTAADRLGVSEGTLSGQLFRARKMLAERLRRRGLLLDASALAAHLAQLGGTANPPAAIVLATAKAGVAAVASPAALAGMVSSTVLSLTAGVIKSMYAHKLKQLAAALAVVVAAVGLGLAAYAASAPPPARSANANQGEPPPPPELRKPDAVKEDTNDNGTQLAVDLLRNRKVLRELKCTVEQWDKLEDILEAAERRIEKAERALLVVPPPPGPNGPADYEQQGKQFAKIYDQEYQKATKDIYANVLDAGQVKRFGQLELQARSVEAFQLDRVVKALKLTDRQQARVKDLIAKATEAVVAKVQEGVNDSEELEKQLDAIMAKATKAVQDLLTPEQKKTWAEMVGEPVRFRIWDQLSSGIVIPAGIPLQGTPAKGGRPARGSNGLARPVELGK